MKILETWILKYFFTNNVLLHIYYLTCPCLFISILTSSCRHLTGLERRFANEGRLHSSAGGRGGHVLLRHEERQIQSRRQRRGGGTGWLILFPDSIHFKLKF